jgi:histidyl-tRNA synthetase
MSIQSIRGVHDILPENITPWQNLEAYIRQVLHQYAYQEIRLPIIEKTELFKRAIGDATDIVEKEMYSFTDRNEDSVSLRPEGTAGCVRAGVQHGLLYNQVQKLWYMGPMFRRERPQKGRYRQFHQLGVEAFGLSGADIDAELISLSKDLLSSLKLKELSLEINTIGSKQARIEYCAALVIYLEKYAASLDSDSQRRLQNNPLRILDSKNIQTQEILKGAPQLTDHLTQEDRDYFDTLRTLLADLKIEYTLNPRLVRGLDYYSQSVFEWTSNHLGAQNTVCAGGRYDDLINLLSGKTGSAAGFAIGMERLLEILTAQDKADNTAKCDIYLAVADRAASSKALQIAATLRNECKQLSLRCGSYTSSLKSHLKQADKLGAAYALIIGQRELISGTIEIKSLQGDSVQKQLSMQQLIAFVNKIYTAN